MDLFGNWALANDPVRVRSLQWALKQYDWVLNQRGKVDTVAHREIRTWRWKHKLGRCFYKWRRARDRQWTVRTQGRGPHRFFFTADTSMSDFQLPELLDSTLMLFKPPSLGDFVTAAPGNNYISCVYFNYIRNCQTGCQNGLDHCIPAHIATRECSRAFHPRKYVALSVS